MKVYLDVVFLLNFLVDFLLLLGTNRLSGFPLAAARCALAALLGACYGAACFLPGFRFLGNTLWRLVMLCLMGAAAFGLDKSALRRIGVFVILSMALGGMAVSIGRGDTFSVLLAGGLVWLLCCWAFDGQAGGREYVPVQITCREKCVRLVALRDTGNTLRDPISGEPVLVISADMAKALTGLTREQLASPLETLANRPLPGLRLIPYRAVGCGGMLLAMRFPEVMVDQRRVSAIVAFAPEGLGGEHMYQGLLGGAL